jgi:hypothetical protein
MGNTTKNGVAKFEFVGTNNLGDITTYHVKGKNDIWKLLNNDRKNKVINLEAHS